MGVTFQIIQDDAEPARAGKTLKGFVVADVDDDQVRGASLDLTFRGTESTCVHYTETVESGDSLRTVSRYAHANRSLIRVKLPVDDLSFIQGGHIPRGKYQIPFELQLPESLPESMIHYGNTNHEFCQINYFVKVVLKGSGYMWNYNAEEKVQILGRELPLEAPMPYSAQPVNEEVNFMCCFNQGSVSLGGRVDDTKVGKGQVCLVAISCRNYSSVEVARVTAKLYQNLRWNAKGHMGYSTETLASLDFTKKLLLEGSLACKDTEARESIDIQGELANIFAEIKEGRHAGDFRIPIAGTYSTYSSGLITISHVLEIQVATDGMCVGSPTVSIPVMIANPNPQEEAAAQNAQEASAIVHSNDEKKDEDPYTPSYPPPPTYQPEPEVTYVPPAYEDAIQSPVVFVPSYGVQTGGPIVDGEEEPEVVYEAPSPEDLPAPSFEVLIKAMANSVADWDIIVSKIHDEAWNSVFDSLTPLQFARIIEQVDLDFDQPKVAEAVAHRIGDSFSCAYVVAALETTNEWNRATVVEKTLPRVADLRENQESIKQAMTEWEKLVTERAFEKALNA
eukprot:CAMPEP_0168819566 /NCGR_PEP_ID=MMETSP0726-20121227/8368_1 /TAXON_ID=265536 /ORGANISM="Amphiprora sp., Strain CCMP467" /LENGTH=563 /DNA_ID=CAMNT_0008871987 /DNA_START=1 /DNA_END=1692 /DNA_ORIENTATION=-